MTQEEILEGRSVYAGGMGKVKARWVQCRQSQSVDHILITLYAESPNHAALTVSEARRFARMLYDIARMVEKRKQKASP